MEFDSARPINSALKLRPVRFALVTVMALAVTAIYHFVLRVNPTTVALTFLVLVMLVASRWRLPYAIYLSALCALLYDYFFLDPLYSLNIKNTQDWIAFASFLAAGVLVSQIAEREKRQAVLSENRRAEVEALYEFSRQILLLDHLPELARAAPRMIAEVFHLGAVALYVRDSESSYLSNPDDEVVPAADLKMAAHTPDLARVTVPGVRLVPLMLGLRSTGALAMREGGFTEGMYSAIGGLVAIALERARAVERSSHAEAEREGDRLRSALIDSVTHELRTPLTAIRVAASSMTAIDSAMPAEFRDEFKEMVAIVDEESARLDRLIGQAVEMAQLDAQAIKPRLLPQGLREVIDLAIDDSRSMLRGRPVEIELPEGQPAFLMDRELIRRVLRHLIENAAKYSPPKSTIEISVQLKGERLVVHVKDYGSGVGESEQELIFDKFYRGKLGKSKVQGTGMGLAIAKAILTVHGGGISVRSKPGEGATFTFWIPVAEKNSEIK